MQKLAGLITENTEVINKLVNTYTSLKNAISNPNYPDTAHTRAALIKLEDKINQIAQNKEFKQELEKLIPDFKYKPKQGIGLDNLKRAGGNYLSPHIKR
jgi:hypothetical protein